MNRTSLRAAVAVAVVLALALGVVLGSLARSAAAVPGPEPTSSFPPLRVLAFPRTAADRLPNGVGPRFEASSARLISSPPHGGLYLVRDHEGRVCLLLADDDGRSAATCRPVSELGRLPLTVRLIERRADGVRVGVEAQVDTDGTEGWLLV